MNDGLLKKIKTIGKRKPIASTLCFPCAKIALEASFGIETPKSCIS
jgi:hypothetical protein